MSPSKPAGLKIALNGLFLTRPHTGMGQYTLGLLRALPKALPGARFTVFVPAAVAVKLPPRVKVEVVAPPRSWGRGRGLALDRWEHRLSLAAVAAGADVYHTPYPTPAPEPVLPTVMTVHDMIPFQLPYYRRSLRSRIKQKRILEGIRSADALTTVSASSAATIAEIAGIPEARIQVAYEGLGPDFPRRVTAAAATAVRKTHGLERPYVFYIGGFDYRKNVRRLVAGFGQSRLADTHDLVIAGAADVPAGALYADFHQLSQRLAQAGIRRQTRLIGRVSEPDKAALLKGADMLCYPSLAEGFGLPVLEALAVGTPVATSRTETSRELFTGAVEFFDPHDEADLAAVLRETAGRRSAAMTKRAKEILKEFDWADTARRTASVYRAVTGGRP